MDPRAHVVALAGDTGPVAPRPDGPACRQWFALSLPRPSTWTVGGGFWEADGPAADGGVFPGPRGRSVRALVPAPGGLPSPVRRQAVTWAVCSLPCDPAVPRMAAGDTQPAQGSGPLHLLFPSQDLHCPRTPAPPVPAAPGPLHQLTLLPGTLHLLLCPLSLMICHPSDFSCIII